MRVVLDTNTLVSALLFHRERWSWLREAWQTRRIVPLVCTETAKELIRVLAYPKFKLTTNHQKALLEDILPYCETVTPLAADSLTPCRDPDDQIFLRLALGGSASCLVSGDDDLLTYDGPISFEILTPAQFRELLSEV